jgi:membrane protein involved in colicin uptake
MSESWFSCKPCGSSDPTADTVKIDVSQIDKENVAPPSTASNNYAPSDAKEVDKALEQGTQRWGELQEEAEKVRQQQREAREAAEAAEAAKAAQEERRRKLEEEARLRKAAEEEAARKAAEEAQLREEAQKAAEEAERLRREAEAADAAQKAAEEEEMRRAVQHVQEWCKLKGFQDVNVERKTFRGRKFALHSAVKHLEAEMIKLLLKCGARKDLKDSRGQTPLQLAQKLKVSQVIIDALQ